MCVKYVCSAPWKASVSSLLVTAGDMRGRDICVWGVLEGEKTVCVFRVCGVCGAEKTDVLSSFIWGDVRGVIGGVSSGVIGVANCVAGCGDEKGVEKGVEKVVGERGCDGVGNRVYEECGDACWDAGEGSGDGVGVFVGEGHRELEGEHWYERMGEESTGVMDIERNRHSSISVPVLSLSSPSPSLCLSLLLPLLSSLDSKASKSSGKSLSIENWCP